MKVSIPVSAMLLASIMLSSTSHAADATFTTTASVALTSDYLFRGVSQTSNNAAVQGSMAFNHASGAYLSFWASSIASAARAPSMATLAKSVRPVRSRARGVARWIAWASSASCGPPMITMSKPRE